MILQLSSCTGAANYAFQAEQPNGTPVVQYASSGGNVTIAQQQQMLSKAYEAVNRVKQFVMEHFKDAVIVEERSVSLIFTIFEGLSL